MTHDTHDIDHIARAMTDIEPPHDLEARIKRRLDGETRITPARWTPVYWLGGAGLIATAALLAIVVQGPAESTVQRSSGEQASVSPAISSSPQALTSTAPVLPTSPGARPVSTPVRLPSYRSMSASEAAWLSRRVEALDVIDPIQPERESITPLTMAPVVTSPVFGVQDDWRR